MKTLRILLAAALALVPVASASALDTAITKPQIKDNGDVRLTDSLKIGRFTTDRKFISQPDAVQIQGSGSTGDASGFSLPLGGEAETLGLLYGRVALYPSRAALAAARVPTIYNSVRLAGYATAGDCVETTYDRVAVQPSHAGKVQSLDGAWWVIRPGAGLDVCQFGAKALASLVTPIDTTDAATNTTAIQSAAETARAMGWVTLHIRNRYVHSGELVFVGDQKVIGAGITPHAYAAAQLSRTGPSALLYSGPGTQVTFKNEETIGKPIIRGAIFTGVELITLNGSARALRLNGSAYGRFDIYAIGHDVGVEFDVPAYSATNAAAGGEDGYTCHNDLKLNAQSTKTALKQTGSTNPAEGNVCKNNVWISADYSTSDAIVLGNSDSIDFKETYLYKNAVTYLKTITTTAGSNVVTVNSAANLAVGMTIFTADIPSGATIQSISGTILTLTRATGTANARKTKTGTFAGFSVAAGRGIVSQGCTAYGCTARSNLWSGILEPGEGGIHFLGTEDYAVASQNNEIKAWNYENNSYNAARVVNLGAGASLTFASTDGRRRWTDVEFLPTGRASAEWRSDDVKALGIESNGVVTLRRPLSVAFLNASLAPNADNTTKTKIIAQEIQTDTLSNYNSASGLFTCSNTGLYRVVAKLLIQNSSANGATMSGFILRNGIAVDGQDAYYQHVNGIWGTMDIQSVIPCTAGETLSVAVTASAAVTISGAAGRYVSKLQFEFVQ